MTLFTGEDKRDMLHAAYAIGEIAEGVEFMPRNESRGALASMYGHLSPADLPPQPTDWSKFGHGVDYAAGYYAHMHLTQGAEAIAAEAAYYEEMEREFHEIAR